MQRMLLPEGLRVLQLWPLQLMGHQTVVFEEKPALGGMLRYGIPNYRLPREKLDQEIQVILNTGVEVHMQV